MAIQNDYLVTGNLHAKPLCAHLSRAFLWASISMNQGADKNTWQGRVVLVISKTTLIAGACITIPIALIETVSLFILSSGGIALNTFILSNPSDFVEKYSLKLLSYSLNSSLVFITLIANTIFNRELRYHTPVVLCDQLFHLSSAIITHATIGRSVQQNPEVSNLRIVNLIINRNSYALEDLLSSLQQDFNIHLRDAFSSLLQEDGEFAMSEDDRNFIHDLEFLRLYNDPEYLRESSQQVLRILNELGIIEPNEMNESLYDLNEQSPEVASYQNRLASLLKDSFIEICNDPTSETADENGQTRKELFLVLDGSIYFPLTYYAQYKELLEPIDCPTNFRGNLREYNERRQTLIAAKRLIDGVIENNLEKDLIQKILRGSDYDAEVLVQEAYLQISSLATPLSQGPLMNKSFLNTDAIEGGAFADLIVTKNLFQNACLEAVTEVERVV
ncbi:MAG: hypothetical protein COT85_02840 [Chlamydiae bacterium CG10_big_fil_rev_8_21_14_0_10_42_34]|nr:MAG: hypothetical protein COT85_02840 [Chlamydiae bacterium CG10_big_fil_rev_8_21_14_0_10_42_34]